MSMNGSSLISRLKDRLHKCPETEPEQAIIRVVIVALLVLYLHWVSAFGQVDSVSAQLVFQILAGSSVLISLLILVAIIVNPVKSVKRRVLAMALDVVFISCSVYVGGELCAPLFVVYLWVTFGYGFRYGTSYLFGSMILSIVGFATVTAFSTYWQSNYFF